MKFTRDPVTQQPAIEICNNLVVIKKDVHVSSLEDVGPEEIETVLTPSDRRRAASA